MNDDKRAELILDHYKATFAALLEHWKIRNRLFLYVVLLIALLAVEMCSPGSMSTVVNGYIKHYVLRDAEAWQPIDFSAIDLVVRFLLLCLVIHYYQRSIQVNRMYRYLTCVEDDLRECMAKSKDEAKYYISLAGKAYVSKTGAPEPNQKEGKDYRPRFLRWVGLLYEWIFPSGLIALACASIYEHVLALDRWRPHILALNFANLPPQELTIHGLSALFGLALIFYSLLYILCGKRPRWPRKGG